MQFEIKFIVGFFRLLISLLLYKQSKNCSLALDVLSFLVLKSRPPSLGMGDELTGIVILIGKLLLATNMFSSMFNNMFTNMNSMMANVHWNFVSVPAKGNMYMECDVRVQ